MFDGHAGSKVSKHCSEHLLESICATEDFKKAIKNYADALPAADATTTPTPTTTTSSNNDTDTDSKKVPVTSSASSTEGSAEDIVTVNATVLSVRNVGANLFSKVFFQATLV